MGGGGRQDAVEDRPRRFRGEAALQPAGERISPTLDAILELLDEAPAEGAAAEADDFVRQVAAAGGGAAPLPWAHEQHDGGVGGADGGEEEGQADGEEGREAAMEGVVAEYAYAGPPELADLPAGACCCCRRCCCCCCGGRRAAALLPLLLLL